MVSVYNDWDGVLVNPRFERRDNEISWSGFGNARHPQRLLLADLAHMEEAGQYTFQVLSDGSLLTLYYRFTPTGDDLEAASLGFYHVAAEEPLPWLRLDYAPTTARGVVHSHAHLHSSLGPDVRMAVSGVPSPQQFVEAVMAWFYPSLYARRHLDPKTHTFIDDNRCARINTTPPKAGVKDSLVDFVHILVPDHN